MKNMRYRFTKIIVAQGIFSKGFIARLHVNFAILVILYFLYVFYWRIS